MQHLQYNSPMQIYSREAAEEQYRQQAAQVPQYANDQTAPVPLGGGERHFDPTKSETLKAIQEQENQRDEFLGYDFFDKVANAEAPRVPQSQEPYWAEEARQRSDRARSQTPGGYYRYRTSNWDDGEVTIPSGPPPVYTTGVSYEIGPSYNASLRRRTESDDARKQNHSPVPGAAEHGYLFGGMDYVDHERPLYYDPNDFEYGHVSRRDQQPRKYEHPGQRYGLDFNSSPQRFTGIGGLDAYYHGYAAEKPRKHPKYTADPKEPINIHISEAFESVDPVRLVGDTLSNQKINYDRPLTEEEKRTFAAVFAPPTGFKPEHRTVRQPPKEPGPICLSVSAKKELASPNNETTTPASRSQSAHPFSSADNYWYTTGNKEIMRTEPNWARNVRQRKDAWGHLVQGSQSVVDHRPPWAKIPPPQQPEWTKRAHSAHGTWQTEVDSRGYGAAYQNGVAQSRNGGTQTLYYTDPREAGHPDSAYSHSVGQTQQTVESVEQSQQRPQPQRQVQPNQQQSYQIQQRQHPQQQQQARYYQQGQQTRYQQPVQEYRIVEETQHRHQPQQYHSQSQWMTQEPNGARVVTSTTTTQYSQSNGGPVQNVTVKSSSATRPAPFPVENTVTYHYEQQTSPVQRVPGEVQPQTAFTSTRVENRVTSTGSGRPAAPPSTGQRPVGQTQNFRTTTAVDQRPQQREYVEQSRTLNRTSTEERRQQPAAVSVPPQHQPAGQKQVDQRNYQRYWKKETTEQRGHPAQVVTRTTEKPAEFDRRVEMSETLPRGAIANTFTNATGEYRDPEGRNIQYRRELSTSADPGREYQLLKEEERRIVDEPVEPGVISRHVTTKYYKKKTITENTATTNEG